MHLHASALDFLVFAAYFILLSFFIRAITTKYPDSAIGKGLAYLNA